MTIPKEATDLDSRNIALEIAAAFEHKIGEDVKILKVEKLTTLADYFVIATGGSSTQVRALADEAGDRLKNLGLPQPRREGHSGDAWILLDCNTVIAHVFTKQARDYYALEKLWADAEVITL